MAPVTRRTSCSRGTLNTVSATIRPQDDTQTAPVRRRIGGAAVAAVGASLPEKVVLSSEIEQRLGLAPDWIERRTGIRARHIADLMSASMTTRRSRRSALSTSPELIAATLTSSSRPQRARTTCSRTWLRWSRTRSARPARARSTSAPPVTAFSRHWPPATAMIDSGRAGCVVVVGADLMSRLIDPDDRGTAAVFADGAGAVVLVATGEPSRSGRSCSGRTATRGIIESRGSGSCRDVGHETFKHAVKRLRRRPNRRSPPPASPSTTLTFSSTTRRTAGS